MLSRTSHCTHTDLICLEYEEADVRSDGQPTFPEVSATACSLPLRKILPILAT